MTKPNRPMMLEAITTRYFGPDNVRGSRIKATAACGSVTTHWDARLSAEENHWDAAELFALKQGWLDGWHLEGGGLPSQDGYVFVLVQGNAP